MGHHLRSLACSRFRLGSCFPSSENPDLGHPRLWATKARKKEQPQILRLPLVAQDDKFSLGLLGRIKGELWPLLVAHGGGGGFLGALHDEGYRYENRR